MNPPGRGVQRSYGGRYGGLPEWPKGADCKSAGSAYVGSNPTAATASRPPRTTSGVALYRLQSPDGGEGCPGPRNSSHKLVARGCQTTTQGSYLDTPWWSFPRAITKAFTLSGGFSGSRPLATSVRSPLAGHG